MAYIQQELLDLSRIKKVPKGKEILQFLYYLHLGSLYSRNETVEPNLRVITEKADGANAKEIYKSLRDLELIGVVEDGWDTEVLGDHLANPRRTVRRYKITQYGFELMSKPLEAGPILGY